MHQGEGTESRRRAPGGPPTTPKAHENPIGVLKADEHREGFWTYFAVDVIGRDAMVPKVDATKILPA